MHSLLVEQASPKARLPPHFPPIHCTPAEQSPATLQLVLHPSPVQAYSPHLLGAAAWQAPAPLHFRAGT
ncbi:MAG: hypothetical protein SF187_07250 [Deltaproteobacteria bacterium]|nr:hypothetical protein [Deltaproteobacteria bacterium]